MMYYYLFKKSESWKYREVHPTVLDIKDYLGLLKSVREGSNKRAGRKVMNLEEGEIKEAYPKFSQFKKNVLDTSIADINRLRKEGLLDVCVSYEPVYNGKRKVGNPAYIKFCIYDTIEEMMKATAPQEQTLLFADEQPGEREWQQLLSMLDGEAGDELRKVGFMSYDGKTILLKASREQCERVESCLTDDVIKHVKKCSVKVFGKIVNWNYSLSDK